MYGELAGVAAGVQADLALKRPLVVVDAQVLFEAAAVRGCVGTVFAFGHFHITIFPFQRIGDFPSLVSHN